jgi:molybdate transport system substrate-binding protein
LTARYLGALVGGVVSLAACTSTEAAETGHVEVVVSAASSLSGPFEEIGRRFEAEHPGTDLIFNFDSSSSLASQIEEGVPVDIFASAGERDADRARVAAGFDGALVELATNDMVIVTKPGNPNAVSSPDDLVGIGVIALCESNAPCGRYAAEVLAKAGVSVPEADITRAHNATATLTAVAEGDAVAAIVYRSDALEADGRVDLVEIPAANNVMAPYFAAVLGTSEHLLAAHQFLQYLSSPRAQDVFAARGMTPP